MPERISLAVLHYSKMRIFGSALVSFGKLFGSYGYCRSDEEPVLSPKGASILLLVALDR